MLVISFDAIPRSYEEVILAIKGIPAFIIAVVQLVWIWYTQNKWSRRYGLDTAMTVVLSTALLIVVLIYIYPMRIMAQGFFAWISRGYFHISFNLNSLDELAAMNWLPCSYISALASLPCAWSSCWCTAMRLTGEGIVP